MYLWRAVDSEGEVLDILVQSRRNKKAALKLMRKLLKKQGYAPNKVVTDKLPSYGAALRDLNMTGKHVTGGRSNNRAENSHLPVPQTNGVAERFNRTLKEQIIHGRIYRNIAELRNAVRGFVEQYNAQWIVEKNGYLSPAQARQAWHTAMSLRPAA